MAKIPKNSGKSPSFQFYHKDWLGDQKLKRASYNAKGVWIDLICCSMDMPVLGIFADYINDESAVKRRPNDGETTKIKPKQNGVTKLTKREINQLLTGDKRKSNDGITELIRRGILKQDEKGCFYVKRIKRDMELRRIRQAAGKKGGNPVLLKQNANQKPTPSTSTSTSVITTPPVSPKGKVGGFSIFWETYPKKKAKQEAEKAWKKLNPSEELLRIILRAIGRQKQTEQWQKEKGKYIPYPATWLNNHRWEDETEAESENQFGTHPASAEEIEHLEKLGVL